MYTFQFEKVYIQIVLKICSSLQIVFTIKADFLFWAHLYVFSVFGI